MGRALRTKETLPDFLKWSRVTRHPLVFRGLKGSQRTPGFWGVTLVIGGCFRCGTTDHMIAHCPRGLGSSRNPQGSGSVSEIVNLPAPTAPARAYAMQALEEQDAPDVITGMYSLFNN